MDVVFYLDLENIIKARKHSSGKHTVPFCGYEGYDVTSYLVVPMFLWGGEVWSQDGGMALPTTSPSVNRQEGGLVPGGVYGTTHYLPM